MKNIYYVIVGIVIGLLIASGVYLAVMEVEEVGSVERVTVTKIVDGDTVFVEGGRSIRLLDIDTEEKGQKCYGAALDILTSWILEEEVDIVAGAEDRDMYGRELRYIFFNGENINVKLVREGYAVAMIYGEGPYSDEIREAEQYAMNNRIGCKWL